MDLEPPPGFEPGTPGSLGTRGHVRALTRPVLCPLSYGGALHVSSTFAIFS
ncbi:hypothetical protein PYJP_10440 [Pyrofollis japonicus]|nr:hypothetical protein PYJP_10440 [Pyrofollis japonicus]